jgi:hypothetical protein
MRNMIIKSERANPWHDDHPYDRQGPLTTFDHDEPLQKYTGSRYLSAQIPHFMMPLIICAS